MRLLLGSLRPIRLCIQSERRPGSSPGHRHGLWTLLLRALRKGLGCGQKGRYGRTTHVSNVSHWRTGKATYIKVSFGVHVQPTSRHVIFAGIAARRDSPPEGGGPRFEVMQLKRTSRYRPDQDCTPLGMSAQWCVCASDEREGGSLNSIDSL